ncbi:uncharacterized protein [Palaemon carinicauda]|uniref:uncharacterized protein n=1 Tax=Palaemon carinicauda TaxID=392227 RepID=UPI0035B5E78F
MEAVINKLMTARAYPVGNAQIHRPNSARNRQGLLQSGRLQLKKRAPKSIRIGTLNVGTMTGRGREVVDMMERRKVQILCVQETRWKGNKAKEIGAGYKLFFYSGCTERGRNGVGIILTGKLKSCVLEVKRLNDRIMRMKLEWDGEILNVISVYASQTGCPEEEKDDFWRQLDQEMINVPNEELLMIGGDLNCHVGRNSQGRERIHRGWALGDRNQDGERVMDFAVAFDMAVFNAFFEKQPKYLTTYKSCEQESQIDFVLGRRVYLKEIRNCKIFPGDAVTPQHRLLTVDWDKKRTIRGRQEMIPKIRWWKLKEPEYRDTFIERILVELGTWDYEDVDEWREWNSSILKRVGREVLGMSTGKGPRDKETWRCSNYVQEKIRIKKNAKKRLYFDTSSLITPWCAFKENTTCLSMSCSSSFIVTLWMANVSTISNECSVLLAPNSRTARCLGMNTMRLPKKLSCHIQQRAIRALALQVHNHIIKCEETFKRSSARH